RTSRSCWLRRLVKRPPRATLAVLRASASGCVAEIVRVANPTWLWVLSGMSTVMTVRGASLGKGGRRDGGTDLGRQAPKRSGGRGRVFSGAKPHGPESGVLWGGK